MKFKSPGQMFVAAILWLLKKVEKNNNAFLSRMQDIYLVFYSSMAIT